MLAVYVNDDLVAFVTVNVTLPTLLPRLFVTLQTPLVLVVQLVVPVAPFVHFTYTSTPESGCSFAL